MVDDPKKPDGGVEPGTPKRNDAVGTLRHILSKVVELEFHLSASIKELEFADQRAALVAELDGFSTTVALGPVRELMTLAEVAEKLGICTNTLLRMRREGKFPEPIRVSERKLAYRRSEFEQWMLDRGLPVDG